MQTQQQQKNNPSPPPPGIIQRTFTTGNETIDATITISSRSGEISGDDVEFLKDYLDFLAKGWRRKVRPASLTDFTSQDPSDES